VPVLLSELKVDTHSSCPVSFRGTCKSHVVDDDFASLLPSVPLGRLQELMLSKEDPTWDIAGHRVIHLACNLS